MIWLLLLQTDPLHEKLDVALKAGELTGREFRLVDGERGWILGDGEAIVLTEKRAVAWSELAPASLASLAALGGPDLAAFHLKHDRVEEANAILDPLGPVKAGPVLDEGLDPPPGGWAWDKSIGFWPGGKETLNDWKKALAAAQEIRKARDDEDLAVARSLMDAAAVDSAIAAQIERLGERSARLRARDLDDAVFEKIAGGPAYTSELKKARAALLKARTAAIKVIMSGSAFGEKTKEKGKEKIDAELAKIDELWTGQWVQAAADKHLKDLEKAADASAVRRRLVAAGAVAVAFEGSDAKEQGVYDYRAKVIAYNARFKFPENHPESVRDLAWILNAYRHKLGIRMLFFETRLCRAAQKHSINMEAKGVIYHDDGNDTMVGRVNAEGFTGQIGENVLFGADDGQRAHDMWYASPGHHRNMIGPQFTGIGFGREKTFWCQVFGDMAPPGAISE